MATAFGIPSDLFSADHDVEMYRVIYPMPYLGDTVNVSGALFVPWGLTSLAGCPSTCTCMARCSSAPTLRRFWGRRACSAV